MYPMCHHRFLTRCNTTLANFVVWIWSMAVIVPPVAQAVEPPLGMVTGSREAQMSLDGKLWATLSTSSNPVYEGTMIRTGKGAVSALLKDGAQLELQPRTLIRLSGSRMAPVVNIAVGQVLFRVPASSRAAFVTPTVRYQAATADVGDRSTVVRVKTSLPSVTDAVGEIAVNRQGGSRIGLQQGEMLANSVSDPGLHLIKAGQRVYIPLVGTPDPSLGVLLAQTLPDEAAGGTDSTSTDPVDHEIERVPVAGTVGIDMETAAGLGVGLAAIGGGVALSVNQSGGNHNSSPSVP